jgi:hypothetical protein
MRASELCELRDAWAAFRAAAKQCAARGQLQAMARQHPLLRTHVMERRARLCLQYSPHAARPAGLPDRSAKAQIRRLVGGRRDVVALLQVGNHAELLRPADWRRARLRPQRLGKGRFGAGVRLPQTSALVGRLLCSGNALLWCAQTGERAGALAERTPVAWIVPLDRARGYWRQQVGTPWPAHRRPEWKLRRCTALRRHGKRKLRQKTACIASPAVQAVDPPLAEGAATPAASPAMLPNGQYLLPLVWALNPLPISARNEEG